MASLVNLPKDVLTYILSIVIYDTYAINYTCIEANQKAVVKEHLTCMSCGFYRFYEHSLLAPHMKNFGLVHPVFRQILREATKIDGRKWGFHKHFFNTLVHE